MAYQFGKQKSAGQVTPEAELSPTPTAEEEVLLVETISEQKPTEKPTQMVNPTNTVAPTATNTMAPTPTIKFEVNPLLKVSIHLLPSNTPTPLPMVTIVERFKEPIKILP